jgi:hypothetical protein
MPVTGAPAPPQHRTAASPPASPCRRTRAAAPSAIVNSGARAPSIERFGNVTCPAACAAARPRPREAARGAPRRAAARGVAHPAPPGALPGPDSLRPRPLIPTPTPTSPCAHPPAVCGKYVTPSPLRLPRQAACRGAAAEPGAGKLLRVPALGAWHKGTGAGSGDGFRRVGGAAGGGLGAMGDGAPAGGGGMLRPPPPARRRRCRRVRRSLAPPRTRRYRTPAVATASKRRAGRAGEARADRHCFLTAQCRPPERGQTPRPAPAPPSFGGQAERISPWDPPSSPDQPRWPRPAWPLA